MVRGRDQRALISGNKNVTTPTEPRLPGGSEHGETTVPSNPGAQQRYSIDLVLRERALPDCLCLAAEHSTDSSEIASIDD
jgi:hypothetical protein